METAAVRKSPVTVVSALDRRIDEIDATRGVAMLFVCLSHFAMAYFDRTGARQLALWSYVVSYVASPTFMLLSGMMLGLLYRKHRADFEPMRLRLIGRGVYLLTIIHFVILIPHIVFERSIPLGLHWMFMTDTIGVCMIVGALLVDRISTRARILLAITLYVAGTVSSLFWQPVGGTALLIKDIFVGEDYAGGFFREVFALVPWFSYYFGASVVGEWLAESRTSQSGKERFAENLWKWAAVFSVVSALLLLTKEALRPFAYHAFNFNVMEILSTTSKRPPSPAYFIVHCSMALVVLAAFYSWGRSNALARFGASIASLHGRSSLFVYVLHYYIYLVFLIPFTSSFSNSWPVLFIGSLVIMTVASYFWDRGDLQKRLIFPSLSLPASTTIAGEGGTRLKSSYLSHQRGGLFGNHP